MTKAPADFQLVETARGVALALVGDWTAEGLQRLPETFVRTLKGQTVVAIDTTKLGRIDTAGALVLTQSGVARALLEAPDQRADLRRLAVLTQSPPPVPPPTGRQIHGLYRLLVGLGHGVVLAAQQMLANLVFYGHLIVAIGRMLKAPRRFRPAAVVSQMQRAGLDAMPIVMGTNFFVGVTIAFLGSGLLKQFGASIFTVDLVGVGVLREFAVLITAVILAGRSASSFAAEIGAMRMNEEVDAMQVMGVDPFDALVIPRFFGLIAMTPLLTFAGMMAGVLGGVMISWVTLDLSPALFLGRMSAQVDIRHFWLGIGKSPVMAMVIAAIGCRQGMEVGGDVEQLGRRVTQAVVQALFAIIIIDAVFALIYMELNL